MRFASCLAGLLAAGLSAGAVLAKPAYVPSTLNLRAAPGIQNDVVARIPGGSLVDVGDCTANWCAVTWQDKQGFSIQTGLDLSGRVPPRQRVVRRYYRGGWAPIDGPVFYDPPPVYVMPGPPLPYYYPYRYRRYWGRRHWGPRVHFGWGMGW